MDTENVSGILEDGKYELSAIKTIYEEIMRTVNRNKKIPTPSIQLVEEFKFNKQISIGNYTKKETDTMM